MTKLTELDLTVLSAQALFKVLAIHLLKQGRKSMQSKSCRYRAPDGCMCAAGPAIPDNKYKSGMEGQNILHVNAVYNLGYSALQEDAMYYLQIVHDKSRVDEWQRKIDEYTITKGWPLIRVETEEKVNEPVQL